jgi:hypothetical protein
MLFYLFGAFCFLEYRKKPLFRQFLPPPPAGSFFLYSSTLFLVKDSGSGNEPFLMYVSLLCALLDCKIFKLSASTHRPKTWHLRASYSTRGLRKPPILIIFIVSCSDTCSGLHHSGYTTKDAPFQRGGGLLDSIQINLLNSFLPPYKEDSKYLSLL